MGIVTGAVLTCVGMWVKVLITSSNWFYMIGNAIAGVGQPFFMNTYTLVGLTWFSERS